MTFLDIEKILYNTCFVYNLFVRYKTPQIGCKKLHNHLFILESRGITVIFEKSWVLKCWNPWVCSNDHIPNSTAQIPARIPKFQVRYSRGGTGQWEEREYRKDAVPCAPNIMRSQRLEIPPGASLHCAVVLGLQPEFLYDFQVSARISGKNYGPWSRVESARTSGGPVQVLGVDKIGSSESHLEVRWNVRPADQPRVIGFRVRFVRTE